MNRDQTSHPHTPARSGIIRHDEVALIRKQQPEVNYSAAMTLDSRSFGFVDKAGSACGNLRGS